MAGSVRGITIKLLGDTSGLSQALKGAEKDSRSLSSELRNVQKELKFQPTNVDLLRQKEELLKEKISATTTELKAHQAALSKLKDSGVDETNKDFRALQLQTQKETELLKNYNRELKQTSVSVKTAGFKDVGAKMKGMGQGVAQVGAGMTIAGVAAVAAGKQLVEASEAQSQAEEKLTEIYRKHMGATKAASKSTIAYASKLQKVGVVGDEVTLAGAQQLATFAKTPATVNKLLPAMDNLLVQQKGLNGTQQDATNIANLMGKAMMGNTGALKRVGISFTDAQEKVLKYGTEEEKASMLSKVITKKVGEMNKKFAETDAGKIQQAKNAIGDLKEKLGAQLLPVLADLAGWFSKNIMPKLEALINFMESHPIIAKITVAITGILAIGGPLLTLIGGLIAGLGMLVVAGAPVLAAGAATLGIIAAVIAAGIGLYALLSKIGTLHGALGKKIAAAWSGVKKNFSNSWSSMKKDFSTSWKSMKSSASGGIGKVKKTVSSGWASVRSATGKVWGGIKSTVASAGASMKLNTESALKGMKTAYRIHGGGIKGVAASCMYGVRLIFGRTYSALNSMTGGRLGAMVKTARGKFDSFRSAASSKMGAAAKVVRSAISRIESAFHRMRLKFPHIDTPHFSLKTMTKKVGKHSFTIPSGVDVSWYAKGAIFKRPTLLGGNSGVGDDGAEAALPLSELWKHLDPLVENANQPIVYNVTFNVSGAEDPETFASRAARELKRLSMMEG